MSRSRTVVRNLVTTVVTQLLTWSLAFVINLLLPHAVGSLGFGTLGFASSFLSLFGSFNGLGTSTVIVKEIATNRDRTAELLSTALVLRIPLALAIALLAYIVAVATHRTHDVQVLVALGASAMIVGAVNDAFACALQGQEKIQRQNVISLVEKFLTSIGILLLIFVLKHPPVWSIGLVGALVVIVSLGFYTATFWQVIKQIRMPHWAAIWTLVLAGLPFFGIGIFRNLYNQMDASIIGYVAPNQHLGLLMAGWYALPARLLGSAMFIPVAMAMVLLPTLTRLHEEDPDRFAAAIRRAHNLVLVVVLPIAIPIALSPNKVLFDLLPYHRSEFQNSAPIFSIYGYGLVLWYITQITGTALIVAKQENKIFRISIIALILTLLGCFTLIPMTIHAYGNGGIGAAITDTLVEVFMVVAFYVSLPKGLFNVSGVAILIKSILAALPLILLMFEAHGRLECVLALVIGYVAYGLLCLLFGSVNKDDVDTFKDALVKRKS